MKMFNSQTPVSQNSTPLLSNKIFLRSIFSFFSVCIFAFAPLFFRFEFFGDFIFIFDGLTIIFITLTLALMSLNRKCLTLGLTLGIGSVLFMFSIPYFLGGGLGILSFGLLLGPFSILILLAQFIFHIISKHKEIQYIQKMTIFIMVFSILFLTISLTDYLRERAVRFAYSKNDYDTYTAQDFLYGQSVCQSLISPFNKEGCNGYFWWRINAINIKNEEIERRKQVEHLKSLARVVLEKDVPTIPYSGQIPAREIQNHSLFFSGEIKFDYKKNQDIRIRRQLSVYSFKEDKCNIQYYLAEIVGYGEQINDPVYGEIDISDFQKKTLEIKPGLELTYEPPIQSGKCTDGVFSVIQR